MLPNAVTLSAWILAQVGEAAEALTRLQEGEEILERHVASGIGYAYAAGYHALGRAALRLGRLDEARSLAD
jgi:hypothetical protein